MDSATLTEAAEKAGTTPRSIYTWLRTDAAFREAYNTMRANRLQAVADLTAANASEAISTLKEIMADKDERAGARITAARILLDAYLRLTELTDFEIRLSAIEETLSERR